jgi:hypothetical protein
MSQAFVKEEDDQWLHEIPGTLPALINFLTKENNGVRVQQVKLHVNNGIEIYEMSNWLEYQKDSEGRWQVVI